jgi:ribosomal-protein-alanine N-acetyltransferase
MSAVLSEELFTPRLRPMQAADLPDILAIEQAAYTHPWSFNVLQDCLRVGYRAWVLTQADTIIGYGFLSVAAGEAHVLNICIHPEQQNKGYGRYLLQHFLRLSRQHGADTIFLEVRPSNPAALHLYTDLGFNQVGTRKNYYPHSAGREDAWILAMSLIEGEE